MGTGGEKDEKDASGSQDGTAGSEQSSHDPRLDIWKPEHNIILAEWADKAMCYRWLHFKSYNKYNSYSTWFTIPVIIISTLTGTANFAGDKIQWAYTSSVIGAFNIIAGIISTIQHFLKVNELNEAHKFASLAWDKFYRNIKVELSKRPEDRMSAYHMLKMYKEEYDRLMETCPVINDDIINMFKKSFKDNILSSVTKPEICDAMIPTFSTIYKEPVVEAVPVPIVDDKPTVIDIEKMRAELAVAKFRETNMKSLKDRKILENFVVDFQEIHSRKPVEDEVVANLKDKVDAEVLKKIFKKM